MINPSTGQLISDSSSGGSGGGGTTSFFIIDAEGGDERLSQSAAACLSCRWLSARRALPVNSGAVNSCPHDMPGRYL